MVLARRLKYLFLFIPVLVAALTAWHLGPPGGEEDAPEGDLPRIWLQPGEAHVVELDLVEHGNGHTLWRLAAPQAKRHPDGGIRISEPRLTLYREEGEPIWLSAGEGLVNEENRQMRFQKRVVATTYRQDGSEARLTAGAGDVDGRSRAMRFMNGVEVTAGEGRLTSASLGYDPGSRVVSTEQPFLFQGQGITLEGEGLRLLLPEQRLLVARGVKARFGDGGKGAL